MRLWHYKLISYLPNTQLLAQWRELNSIFKKQDKHILINYIYEYERYYLYVYSLMVMQEMKNRRIVIKNFDNFNKYLGFEKKNVTFLIPEVMKKDIMFHFLIITMIDIYYNVSIIYKKNMIEDKKILQKKYIKD